MVRLRSPAPYGRFPEWPKGTDCKSAGNAFGGSNPPSPTNKKRTFVYQKFSFCLSKPQAWYIITVQSAVYIISPCGAVSHHASACISLRLDDIQHFVLMIYRNKLRMIYTPSARYGYCSVAHSSLSLGKR